MLPAFGADPVGDGSPVIEFYGGLQWLSPLPAGEGQGEGEHHLLTQWALQILWQYATVVASAGAFVLASGALAA